MQRYIYHLTQAKAWEQAQAGGVYRAPSLDDEGFIHASGWEQVLWVANAFYQGLEDVVLLTIDTTLLEAEVRWEAPVHPNDREEEALTLPQDVFPHIYGVINIEAVIRAEVMPRREDGVFYLPPRLA